MAAGDMIFLLVSIAVRRRGMHTYIYQLGSPIFFLDLSFSNFRHFLFRILLTSCGSTEGKVQSKSQKKRETKGKKKKGSKGARVTTLGSLMVRAYHRRVLSLGWMSPPG